MHAERVIIFDLDGTLTQSEEGIWNSVLNVADTMGFPRPDAETLRKFIGPPLMYSFTEYMGMTDAQAEEAVAIYRRRYVTVGLFENRVYPGIRRLLRLLKAHGWYTAIATGKPTPATLRILEHFRLRKYFDRVEGAGEGKSADKEELIASVLPESRGEAWMVGDRRFDVEGGKAHGLKTIGAGWGYGSREELEGSGCDVWCETVQDLIRLLFGEETVPGAFISMEGPDGSGKTTQLAALRDGLERFGFEVTMSREPGGCPISEEIRRVLLDPANREMQPETEMLLYAASRAQHVRQVIRPVIRAGGLLLCDRFVDSSAAYQGGGRQLGIDRVLGANAAAVDGTLPDVTVYLDIDHRTAMARRLSASVPDRLELEAESFHARVEAAYHQLIARDPDRFVVVDAARSREEIADQALQCVLDRLEEAGLA